MEHCWSLINHSNPQVSWTHTSRPHPELGLHSGNSVGTLFSNPTHAFRVSRTHTLERRQSEQGSMPGGSWYTVNDRTLPKGHGCTLQSDHHPEQGPIQGKIVGTLSSIPEAAVGTPSWTQGELHTIFKGHRRALVETIDGTNHREQRLHQPRVGGWNTASRSTEYQGSIFRRITVKRKTYTQQRLLVVHTVHTHAHS